MANYTVKYFSGDIEVKDIHTAKSNWLNSMKAKKSDSFYRYIGHTFTGPDAIMPITRIINYKKRPSLHKCDARCMNAKGNNCECSCGGANHGRGNEQN